jgi:hypothetical protein
MVCKFSKSAKNKEIAVFFVYNFDLIELSTKKQGCHFIFWPILTIRTQFRIFIQNLN